MWVINSYTTAEGRIWAVGFYEHDDTFVDIFRVKNIHFAAILVNYLNGGERHDSIGNIIEEGLIK